MSNYVNIIKGSNSPNIICAHTCYCWVGEKNGALKGLSDRLGCGFFRLMCWLDRVGLWVFSTDVLVRCCVKMGQSEPAPTSAPMWMDGWMDGWMVHS
jgi:hypothetical protein